MLPDELRNKKEDLEFLTQWKAQLPAKVVQKGSHTTFHKSAIAKIHIVNNSEPDWACLFQPLIRSS